MESIKRLVVVTTQGVETFLKRDLITIETANYYNIGDPYPCFHVLDNGVLKTEIRCIDNLVIEYE